MGRLVVLRVERQRLSSWDHMLKAICVKIKSTSSLRVDIKKFIHNVLTRKSPIKEFTVR